MNIALPLSTTTRLALAIVDNDWREAIALDPRIGHDDQPRYTDAEWRAAAAYALDGDDSDLNHMLALNGQPDPDADLVPWSLCGAKLPVRGLA